MEDMCLGRTRTLPQLRYRTRLKVTCELVRASVKHARHVAEIWTDEFDGGKCHVSGQLLSGVGTCTNVASAVSSAVNTKFVTTTTKTATRPGRIFPCGEILNADGRLLSENVVGVTVTNQERWGSSTDGISESSSSRVVLPAVMARRASKTGRSKPSVNQTAAKSCSQPTAVSGTYACTCRTVAQIVDKTINLCHEGPQFICRALATVTNIGTPGQFGEFNPNQSPEDSNSSLETAAIAPTATATGHSDSSIIDQPARLDCYWVFTGVINVLILARAFRATTTLLNVSDTFSGSGLHNISNSNIRPVSLSSSETKKEVRKGVQSPFNMSSSVKSKTPGSTTTAEIWVIEQQLELLHREAFPSHVVSDQTCAVKLIRKEKNRHCKANRTSGFEARRVAGVSAIGERNLEAACAKAAVYQMAGMEEGEPTQGDSEDGGGNCLLRKSSGNETPAVAFAIPFSWGSLSLISAMPFTDKSSGRIPGGISQSQGSRGSDIFREKTPKDFEATGRAKMARKVCDIRLKLFLCPALFAPARSAP